MAIFVEVTFDVEVAALIGVQEKMGSKSPSSVRVTPGKMVVDEPDDFSVVLFVRRVLRRGAALVEGGELLEVEEAKKEVGDIGVDPFFMGFFRSH